MASLLLQFEVEFAPLDIYFLPVNGNPYLKQSSVAHRNLYLKVRTNDYQDPKFFKISRVGVRASKALLGAHLRL